MRVILLTLLASLTFLGTHAQCQDKIFSGPQTGEKLTSFQVRGFFEPNAGRELDFVKNANGRPIVLVFVHDANRQSLRFTQVLSEYTITQKGLHTGVTWLADDVTEAENTLKRSGHALSRETPTGISLDGKEGPGGFGLNRNVTLTVLVGNEGRVVANFALVQPSIQADLPKVLEEIGKVLGKPAASLEDLLIVKSKYLQGPISQLVLKDATPAEIEKQANAIEKLVMKDEEARKELGRIAGNMVKKGTLSMLGSPRAQEFFKKWAKEYGGTGSK